jgi:predicted RNase H-like HicB family nuclease
MKQAEDFLELPYHFILVEDHWSDGTPGWFIRVAELPGCMSQGATADEAIERIRDAMLGWIDVQLQDGRDVPTPYPEDFDSSVITVPVPDSLDQALAVEARRRGVAVDQLIVTLLTDAVAAGAGTNH